MGPNEWALGDEVAARQLSQEEATEAIEAPVMLHADVEVRRKSGKSFTLGDVSSATGHLIVQFDGGSAQR